ncbi:hypothetical protein BGZ94_005521 [Podila epigama]|nr:hypothetical protein BGZ94_005521 [Podila epigama]
MHSSTRSAVAAIARASSSRTFFINTSSISSKNIARIHTSSNILTEEKKSLFSRLNPFAKPSTPETTTTTKETIQKTEDLKVEIEEEEIPVPSWKNDAKAMTQEELETAVRSAASSFVNTTDLHLAKVHLNDPSIKFKASREIPNKDLASIHSLKDIVTIMTSVDQAAASASANPKGHVVAEWFENNKSSLPPNMTFIPYQKSRGIKAEDRKTTNKRFL